MLDGTEGVGYVVEEREWLGHRVRLSPLVEGFLSHQWVDHSDGEYVRADVSTNMVEGYFSQLKRSLDGTHHRVSREHLGR